PKETLPDTRGAESPRKAATSKKRFQCSKSAIVNVKKAKRRGYAFEFFAMKASTSSWRNRTTLPRLKALMASVARYRFRVRSDIVKNLATSFFVSSLSCITFSNGRLVRGGTRCPPPTFSYRRWRENF